jgi:hypothetical protein
VGCFHRVRRAGRNHLNEEIPPLLPTGMGERYSQTISNLGHGEFHNIRKWGGGASGGPARERGRGGSAGGGRDLAGEEPRLLFVKSHVRQ